MKKLIILLLFVQNIWAQEVLIPFRIGNKFGLSDIDGNLKLNANYDHINISSNFPTGYFEFEKDGKKGLLKNSKEIISDCKCDYSEYYISQNEYILGHFEKSNASFKSFFSINGINLYPQNFYQLDFVCELGKSNKLKDKSKYILFMSTDFQLKKAIFVFDIDKQLITSWITTNNDDIDYIKEDSYIKIVSHINNNSKNYYVELKNNLISVSQKPLKNKTLTNDIANIEVSEDFSSGYSSSSTSNQDFVENGFFMTRFYLEDDKLFFEKKDRTLKTVKSEINIRTENIVAIENFDYYISDKKSGIAFNINNVVHFKDKNKYGVMILDTLSIKPVYDKINDVGFITKEKNLGRVFLVKIDNKEGIIDLNGNELIPVIYKKIEVNTINNDIKNNLHITGNSYCKVITQESKIGYLTYNNDVILEPIYDEVYTNRFTKYCNYGNCNFYVLKKDSKYGLISDLETKKIFVKTLFNKQIGFYISNYQNNKKLNLVGLIDSNNNLFCLAKENGFLYYKEK